jgi:hypothetical protein
MSSRVAEEASGQSGCRGLARGRARRGPGARTFWRTSGALGPSSHFANSHSWVGSKSWLFDPSRRRFSRRFHRKLSPCAVAAGDGARATGASARFQRRVRVSEART